MPRGDRTGPTGFGPMSGRGMGYCAGFTHPGFASPGPGLRYGRGAGSGRGFGRGFGFARGYGQRFEGFGGFRGDPYPEATPYSTFQPYTEEQEMNALKDQVKLLEGELNQIKMRQEEIKRQKKKTGATNE